ncbi:MAG TPA: peptide deformylase [Alphaproteobacteria bacterium]
MTDIYQILVHPDPVLREVAPQVDKINEDIKAQAAKMIDTMYAAEGVGLAAPQVGILNRLIVVDTSRREKSAPNPIAMVNPELIWKSEELWTCMEGCLSIPLQYADVERPKHCRVKYWDLQGQEQELEVRGLASSCVQHEIDHLNGVLFIDHLSRLKRTNLMKKYEKQQKEKHNVL